MAGHFVEVVDSWIRTRFQTRHYSFLIIPANAIASPRHDSIA